MCLNCIFNNNGICDIKEIPAKEECFLKEEGVIDEKNYKFDVNWNELIGIPKEYLRRGNEEKSRRSL